jgi:hypothetical protein
MGCGGAPQSTYDALPELRRMLSAYALTVEPASAAMVHLAYRPPAASCPQVYRLHARHEPALLHEGDSTSHLVLGHDDRASARRREGAEGIFAGQLAYKGVRAERQSIVREWSLSSEMAGPASPTAACFPRTWDPIDDAFALGWPRVPGGPIGVADDWTGSRVEGKCNRSACIDPQTGAGGPDNHHRTCVTPSWREQLVGVYEIGEERVALLQRSWSDGHGEEGIRTEGFVLVAVDHGRPVWAQITIDHAFPQLTADDRWAPIRRTWTLEAIDDCPGSLIDLGWQRPADAEVALGAMLEDFGRAAELRSGGRKRAQRLEQGDAQGR